MLWKYGSSWYGSVLFWSISVYVNDIILYKSIFIRLIDTYLYIYTFFVLMWLIWPGPKPAPLWSQNQDKTGAGFRFGFLCRFFLPCAGFYYLAPVFVPEIIKIKSQDQDLTGAPVWGQAKIIIICIIKRFFTLRYT